MTNQYQDILDQLDRNGKLEFENEQEVRLAMLKLCGLVAHLFDNRTIELLKSAKCIDDITDNNRGELHYKLNEISDYDNTKYNALKALTISIKKPLQEDEDIDLLFPLEYCIEYCVRANNSITDEQIIPILIEIK